MILELNPDPPDFPSVWSNSYGQDRFGLWQGLELNGVRQVMRWIPPGRFLMGSPKPEVDRDSDENLHDVTISQGFWLADTACTQALWQSVMNDTLSRFNSNPENPADSVSWDDCQSFIEKANEISGGDFTLRLPTEAEWEYAARAGSDSAFWWGDEICTEQANYNGNFTYRDGEKSEYRDSTVEVLQFNANPFGLFQVHGNVLEWCSDHYASYPEDSVTDPQGPANGQDRVLRGGGWDDHPRLLRAAFRDHGGPDDRSDDSGFRLAGG